MPAPATKVVTSARINKERSPMGQRNSNRVELDRRRFLGGAAALPLGAAAGAAERPRTEPGAPTREAIRNAIELGNRFVLWQSPCGAPDPVKCPYRTPGFFNAYHLHGCGPM